MSPEKLRVEENPLSEEAVREILTREAGLKFMVPRSFELPTEYNLHALEGIGVTSKELHESIDLFTNYLKDVVVVDQWYTAGEEDERRQRRRELIEKFGSIAKGLLLHNKLRTNRINTIHGRFSVWLYRTEIPQFKNASCASKIKKLYDAFLPDTFRFHELSLSEKLRVVERIERIVAHFLRFVGTEQMQEKKAAAESA